MTPSGQASSTQGTTKDTDTSQSVPLVQTTTLQDPEGNIQPAGRGAPSTVPHDDTGKLPPVSEGTIGDKDSEGQKPPADMEPSPPHEGAHSSQTDLKDQTDKTQSVGFEGLGPDHNQGKSSNEEEPANQFLQIQSMAEFQAVLLSDDELDKESEDDVFEAGDDLDTDNQST